MSDHQNTRPFVPWLIVSKQGNGSLKHRFITDCRELNPFLQPKQFQLGHLSAIDPYLKKGQVAAKVDPKDAYFHLSLSSILSQFVRVQVGEIEWEFLSACFGLCTLPQLFMQLIKNNIKDLEDKWVVLFVYQVCVGPLR